jgi:predicted lysophospholipase L1 biosynthesis ABC-type transport system permease subunit
MEKDTQHLEQLAEIRDIMSKSTRFLSLSGLSGVVAGIAALGGAWAAYKYLDSSFSLPMYISGADYKALIQFLLIDAAIVLIVAIGFGSIFTLRKAKSKGQSIFDPAGRRLFVNLFIPLLTGGALALILIYHGFFILVPSITLIFYGLALINASKYTLEDIRYLGMCEIILGLISALFIGYGLLFWAIGFGLLHIVYGIIMYYKYDRA